ncbi:tigger transposable element-derived protein 1-like [Erpetoichthys calabaricus]|uniref:tigger transposable element-derived protein 1-like n=1 Tax=Erpetoichthys calabaricus TaxID=27687 RepID=UPI0022342F09|nr:tigger transposable element-derived protein 1-like [Erpetoichthys calabaricus]
MAPKRAPSSKAGAEPKRQRRMMMIAEKVKLLDMLKEGRTFAAVARQYGMNESTVRYIKKEKANIRKTATITFCKSAKRVVTARNKTIVRMESALAEPEDDSGDCEEDEVDVEDPQPGTSSDSPRKKWQFSASKGWFAKFQKRYGLKSVSLQGEAASADTIAAETYVNETFKKIISEGGYRPEKVFNMNETGLFWKRMPSRTFLFKEEAKASGFKAYKDRVTLVVCGNAAGFLLKPGFIYKSKNPRTLKNKNKNLLPVHWMYNPKAWITKMLTSDWFHQCFIPQVKVYLAEKGMPFKVLLIMDNAGGHAADLSYSGVQMEFLPPNTTSLIQPMDQGVIRAFKTLYTRNSLANLVSSVDAAQEDDDFNLKAYWRQYTIATCLQNIQKALQEMKPATINASWKKLWPEVVYDDKGFTLAEIQHSAVQKAVQLAAILGGEGFADMTTDDVNELLDCHSQPLTDEDLEELMKSASEEEEEEEQQETEEVVSPTGLTLERLAEICRLAKDLQEQSQEWDDDMVRSPRLGQ